MSIEEAIYYKTTNAAGITALISTRFYPDKLPQNPTLPAATYQRISTPRVHAHDTSGATGLASPRFQIDCYAFTRLAVKDLANAIRAEWEGFKGTVQSVSIQAVLSQNEMSFYEDVSGIYRQTLDFIIYHQEG